MPRAHGNSGGDLDAWTAQRRAALKAHLEAERKALDQPDAFSKGEYALANILFYPVPNLMFGPEVQWGHRDNFRDGFSSDDLRFQFTVKYNFSHHMEGK